MTRLPKSERLRRYISIAAADNKKESQRGSISEIIRDLRIRFAAETPLATPEEIEERIKSIAEALSRPAPAKVPAPSQGIPKEVRDARRAERKARVRAGKNARRGG